MEGMDPSSVFNVRDPNGKYDLDIADPYQRQVATELARLFQSQVPKV